MKSADTAPNSTIANTTAENLPDYLSAIWLAFLQIAAHGRRRVIVEFSQAEMISGRANRVAKPTPFIEICNRGADVKTQQATILVRSLPMTVGNGDPGPEQESRNTAHPPTRSTSSM